MSQIQESGGGKEKGGKKRSKKSSTKIDMTPMVDLAFLLLTFFMLTTTFAKPQIMDITMPVKDPNENVETPVKASNALTILLGEKDQVYYYQGLLAEGEAEPELIKADYSSKGIRQVLLRLRSNPDLVVMIKPHEESRYNNVVDILDEMAITDIRKYAIVDITDADKELLNTKATI
jgi:biopolymer transport protein ExbD